MNPHPPHTSFTIFVFNTYQQKRDCKLTQSGPPLFKDVTHSCLLVGSLVQNSRTLVSNVPLPSSRMNIATYEKAHFITRDHKMKIVVTRVPFGKSS